MGLSIISVEGWKKVANMAVLSAAILSIIVVMPFSTVTKASAAHPKTDFNGDGYADLAVGVPGEDLGSITDAGAVNIIYGSASGLSPSSLVADQFWTQNNPGVEDAAESGDRLGITLASG